MSKFDNSFFFLLTILSLSLTILTFFSSQISQLQDINLELQDTVNSQIVSLFFLFFFVAEKKLNCEI